MAQQTTVTYLDDIDGTKAAETVPFALDGAKYEIDLSAKNAKVLRKAFGEFIGAARPVRASVIAAGRTTATARGSRKATAVGRADKGEVAAIRAWAAANNITIAARGRIAADVKAQYAAAQG